MTFRSTQSRWRSRRCRFAHRRSHGVSDIVATILIVAITVVLAAVLYLLVTSLTKSSASDPLGSAFTWGAPTNATGVPTLGCAGLSHYCYLVQVAYTGTGLAVTSLTLGVNTANGLPAAWPTSVSAAGGKVLLINPSTSTVAANYWPSNSTWQLIPPYSGTLTAGFLVVIYCGGAAEGAGQGLSGLAIVAVGTNGYGGTVTAAPFS